MKQEKIKITDFFGSSNHKLIIRDISATYHHMWDILGETLQNAVDSVNAYAESTQPDYTPEIKIVYNTKTLEITIQDNGTGIAPEHLKKIVAPHYSLKNPTDPTKGEFGVGLTFVAFNSNDFSIETVFKNIKSEIKIKNGYSWFMDDDDNVEDSLEITFSSTEIQKSEKSYTKVSYKPVRFPDYDLSQLKYIIQRYTAVADFWACYKNENGRINVIVEFIGDKTNKETIENKFWRPADYFKGINRETVDFLKVQDEIGKGGKETATPNWIGNGLVDKDKIVCGDKEFSCYALLCKTNLFKDLAEKIKLGSTKVNEEEENNSVEKDLETVSPGIIVCKKGMPLGAVIEPPKRVLAGFWRMLFIVINCDSVKTEPGRKRLYVEDEKLVKKVTGQIFDKLTRYQHYFISRDPDEQFDSLLRNVDKNIDEAKKHCRENKLINVYDKIRCCSQMCVL